MSTHIASPFETPDFHRVRFVLMDIEGTTSDIHFVKNVLFPYSARMLPEFLKATENAAVVSQALKDTSLTDADALNQQLQEWIVKDVKHPVLKSLQGVIWEKGYKSGAFRSHLYADVLPAWQRWQAAHLKLGIYSSGSVQAQKQFFAHTESGDVLGYLSAHFDLSTGPKRETKSYTSIAAKLEVASASILFLSDIPEELVAAREAGMQVAHIVRKGTAVSPQFGPYKSFEEI